MALQDQSPFAYDTRKSCAPKWGGALLFILGLLWLTVYTFDSVYCFLFDQFSSIFIKASYIVLKLSARHTESLNFWCRGTLKVTLRLSRHVGSLTQLSYVSIIVT